MSGRSTAAEGVGNRFVYVVAGVAALDGLLFGYDTACPGGVGPSSP